MARMSTLLASSMSDVNDWNRQIIDDFRANDGKVGGRFEGAPMILVHHRGARTGAERVTPLVYLPYQDTFVVFGSKAGAPTHPHWYLNLVANPETDVEVGSETIPVRARVAEGDEREQLWSKQKQLMPGFAEYEKTTGDRQIPVVILERR
jgi:deazaflavin-dependent oxidoreductase (nitroreductase family)